jgi:hypothetical protein
VQSARPRVGQVEVEVEVEVEEVAMDWHNTCG